jgi:hypothetical protein
MNVEWRKDRASSREVAYHGDIPIGAVIVRSPRESAWVFWLPRNGPGLGIWQPLRSRSGDDLEKAKAAVLEKFDAWLKEAKLGPYEMASDGLGLRGQ